MTPSSATHICVVGGERPVPLPDLLRPFGADIAIRLQAADFALLAQAGPVFTHFNLPNAVNPIGSRCVLLPIVVPGRLQPDGQEILPVVDPAHFRMATCVGLVAHCAFADVTAEQFATSLPTIRDADALRAALMERYRGLVPHGGDAEISAGGCSLTRLLLDPVCAG